MSAVDRAAEIIGAATLCGRDASDAAARSLRVADPPLLVTDDVLAAAFTAGWSAGHHGDHCPAALRRYLASRQT